MKLPLFFIVIIILTCVSCFKQDRDLMIFEKQKIVEGDEKCIAGRKEVNLSKEIVSCDITVYKPLNEKARLIAIAIGVENLSEAAMAHLVAQAKYAIEIKE